MGLLIKFEKPKLSVITLCLRLANLGMEFLKLCLEALDGQFTVLNGMGHRVLRLTSLLQIMLDDRKFFHRLSHLYEIADEVTNNG
jgi:hypothetical protein